MQDEEDGDDTLSIGQLAAQAGVTPQLIRTWESRFGFPHPRRLASGHRRYARADIAAVREALGRAGDPDRRLSRPPPRRASCGRRRAGR